MTRLDSFDYDLPEQLIAQYPCKRRDGSRLLVVDRSSSSLADRHFYDLPQYLSADDILVLNSSRVVPTRLFGRKQAGGGEGPSSPVAASRRQTAEDGTATASPCPGTPSAASRRQTAEDGANIELFLLKQLDVPIGGKDCWQALSRPARRLKRGSVISFAGELQAEVLDKQDDGIVTVSLSYQGELLELLQRIGHMPLPPYIHRQDELSDAERYQTVYAKLPGSVAAPTAGLHFSEELLEQLRGRGVRLAYVTLHVGLGTFKPVQSENIEEHRMHQESYHIDKDTAALISDAKAAGQRIVCVGTTAVRALESACITDSQGRLAVKPGWGSTDIFIYPGGRGFNITDALITNFHLPKSTLLMLVAAFYSTEGILSAYAHAVQKNYRFFSYGDAMLVV